MDIISANELYRGGYTKRCNLALVLHTLNTLIKKMKKILSIVMLAAMLCSSMAWGQNAFYKFKMKDLDGKMVSMKDYKGKVVLVVNVASRCGLTPQYEGLVQLYHKYKDQGLVVLGFPCNQFLGQEPGSSDEIRGFCSANYGVDFPIFEKIEVNGENAAPLYKWLKKQAPFAGYPEQHAEFAAMLDQIHQKTGSGYDKGDEIRWNFGKFLLDRKGKVVARIEPMVTPEEMEAQIVELLGR